MSKKEFKDIKGCKGDPDPPRTPVEEPNTLQSRAVVRFVDLLCEGEIEGLVDGENSIFFNNIPIRNASSEYNFNGISSEFKPGAPDGVSLKDYPTSESEISVDTKLSIEAGPVTKNISDPDIDDIKLTFTIPSLFQVNNTNGDILKTSVAWRIDIRQEGGDWQTVKTLEKYGKCVSSYQTDFRIDNLTRRFGVGPWDIRCLRLTSDSESNSVQNDIYWNSYTQILNRILIYPDTSLIGITLNAQQFGSRVPQRAYEVYGLRVQIPSNYNPITRTYTGIWDGTFQRAYSNNPAWVWYDIINNDRYGLGLEAEYIDKWTLYSIAQYCDQLIPDGFGGYEPRFTFNGVLQSRHDAIHVLNMVSSAFNGMPFWGGGKASVSQDSPKTSSKLVTAANVVDGLFTYSYSADDTRYTVCNVSWNDPDNSFKLQVEAVDDKIGIERYGYRPIDVTAVGCTSRGQAYRFGRWFLYTSLYETETVSYRASWDQADVLPGEVITVMDNHEAATRHGGRIASVGASSVTLDAAIELEIGQTYSITCIAKDGTLAERDVVDSSDGLEHDTLNLNTPWEVGNEPQPDGMWIVTATNIVPKLYRVVSTTEVEPNIFEIAAVTYDPNKFAIVEEGRTFAPPPITKVPDFNTPLTPPTNLQLELYTYEDTGGTSERADRKFGVILSWTHTRDTRFQNYEVQWKKSTGSYSDNELVRTTDTQYDIKPIESGVYNFRVRATGLTWESTWLTISEYTVNAVPNSPPQITGLVVLNGDDDTTFNGKDCEIGWDALTLSTDTTSPIIYDGTSVIPTKAAPFDSMLTKVKDYQIEVMKTDDTHLRYEYTTENSFKYYFGINQLDNGTPIRNLKFRVWARDIFDQLSDNPAVIVVTNPAPSMSGLTPTVTAMYNGVKVDWSAITPTDNDLQKFRVYLDTNNPPITSAGDFGVNTSSMVALQLTPDTTYRAQIEPYDEFGVGTKSNISSAVPLKIAIDDIDTELIDRLTISDSLDSTSLIHIYDHVTDSGPDIEYGNGDWIKVAFPTEQLLDRVSVWGFNSGSDINCYFSTSVDGNTWTYYKGQANHALDLEGRLEEAIDESDAQTNFWAADAGDGNINLALFPNGLAMKYARIHFTAGTVKIYELLFTDQVIAEWIVANQLSAISADLGQIAAGTLQSINLSTTEGVFIDLDNEIIQFGGTSNPSLSWDGTKVELNIGDDGSINIGEAGTISMQEGGKLVLEDSSVITVGNSIMLDSGEEGDDDSVFIISENTTKNSDTGRLELSGVDYMAMNQGSLTFFYWDSATSQHLPYKNLVRIETGVATNNELVVIPGIFKDAPSITVAPAIMGVYDKKYPNQSQTLRLEAAGLQQYAPYKWRFRPRATLELTDGVDADSINKAFSASQNYLYYQSIPTVTVQSDTYELPPLTRELSVNINSIAYRDWTAKKCVSDCWGKDRTPKYTYYTRGNRAYWDMYLYYRVSGVWASIVVPIRPGGGYSAPTFVDTAFATVKQATDITHWYIKGIVRGFYSEYYTGGTSGSGSENSRRIYIASNLKSSSANLTGTKYLQQGTLNWTAIGV